MKRHHAILVCATLLLAVAALLTPGSPDRTLRSLPLACTKFVHDTTFLHDTTVKSMAFSSIRDGYQRADVYSVPAQNPDSSAATLYWSGDSSVFSQKGVGPGDLWFSDALLLASGTTYGFSLAAPVGRCSSSVTLPGSTYFTQPGDRDTLPAHTAVTTEWAVAASAGFYHLHCDIYGLDAGGVQIYFASLETFTRSTSYVIPASCFSDPSPVYFDVEIEVTPMNGVYPDSDAVGNMHGSLEGYLSASGAPYWLSFYVGTPPQGLDARQPARQSGDVFRAYWKALTGDE